MIQNRIIGAVGPTGVGKTHTVAEWCKDQKRILIFDFHDDDGDDLKQLTEFQHVKGNPRELAVAMRDDEFRVRYVPSVFQPRANYATSPALNWVCDFCFELGNLILVVDEAHLYCTAHGIPNSMLRVAMMGRNRRMSLVYMTQSFSAVHNSITRNTHEFWLWRIVSPADIEGIRQRCGKDVAERVQNLRRIEEGPDGVIPGERLVWTVEHGT